MVAKGPGLEKTGVTVNKWAEFTVDTRRAGKAQVHVAALDADCNAVEVITKDNKDGTYSCRYMPKKNIKHTVIVSYGGVAVPNSPFRVSGRALCRIKLLPVTHVLVDTCMLIVKPVYKLSNVSDDLKWPTNTHSHHLHSLSRLTISMVLEDLFFCSFNFYLSTHISTRPNSFLPVQMTGGRVSR